MNGTRVLCGGYKNFGQKRWDSSDPMYQKITENLPADAHLGEYVTSLDVQAVKPEGACC